MIAVDDIIFRSLLTQTKVNMSMRLPWNDTGYHISLTSHALTSAAASRPRLSKNGAEVVCVQNFLICYVFRGRYCTESVASQK